MYKSPSLDSLRLQTSSSDFILTSTTNQDANASSTTISGGRKAIIPTPNRPIKKGPSDIVEFSSNDDTVVEKVNDNQPEYKDKINQDDDDSFESFIRDNFVPFSGKQSLYEWLDQTEDLFNRFKISRQFRYKAIPLLILGDAKRKYIKYRQSITSFDDFYELLMTHYDTIPSVSIHTQADLTSESVKSSTSNNKTVVEIKKPNVTNTIDPSQLSQSCTCRCAKVDSNDTTNTIGDVSVLTSATVTSDNAKLPLDSVMNDLRTAIVGDFIKHPKIFRGSKDNVMTWVEEIDHLMQIAHVPDSNRLDLIAYSLRADALQWFKNNKSALVNWHVFVREIKKAFTSSFCEELAFKTLESYTQGEHQSVRNFYNEVLKLCKEADSSMSESTKLKNLLNKVKPSIQLEVSKRKPKSPEEFLELAKEVEELLQLSNLDIDTSIPHTPKRANHDENMNASSSFSSGYYRNYNNNYNPNPQRNSQYNVTSSSSTPNSPHSSKFDQRKTYKSNYYSNPNQNTSSVNANNNNNANDTSCNQNRTQKNKNNSKYDTKPYPRAVNAVFPSDSLVHDDSINSFVSPAICQICQQIGHDAPSCSNFQ
ncbi:unnamed protein product [Rotaria magnacalcarata]|uniref:Ty3 transposon capsid-like protein domain-containing protein n=2 Tax=Rotaria magnacalcarata TaxID=392030 RepID=A0A820EY96_9BILA|nr:unnamed protein product [Rotaria magnacalcarata]CAF4253598.1 unnamed protein product [Rotaria magnacalcarata]